MIKVSDSIVILCPPETVFRTAADPAQQLRWDAKHFTKLEVLTPGPVGVGSQFSCVIPWMGRMWYEFTEYNPPVGFKHRSKMAINNGKHVFEFVPAPGGTLFTQTMEVTPRGFGYLVYPFMKILLRKSLRTVSRSLKTFLEKQ